MALNSFQSDSTTLSRLCRHAGWAGSITHLLLPSLLMAKVDTAQTLKRSSASLKSTTAEVSKTPEEMGSKTVQENKKGFASWFSVPKTNKAANLGSFHAEAFEKQNLQLNFSAGAQFAVRREGHDDDDRRVRYPLGPELWVPFLKSPKGYVHVCGRIKNQRRVRAASDLDLMPFIFFSGNAGYRRKIVTNSTAAIVGFNLGVNVNRGYVEGLKEDKKTLYQFRGAIEFGVRCLKGSVFFAKSLNKIELKTENATGLLQNRSAKLSSDFGVAFDFLYFSGIDSELKFGVRYGEQVKVPGNAFNIMDDSALLKNPLFLHWRLLTLRIFNCLDLNLRLFSENLLAGKYITAGSEDGTGSSPTWKENWSIGLDIKPSLSFVNGTLAISPKLRNGNSTWSLNPMEQQPETSAFAFEKVSTETSE